MRKLAHLSKYTTLWFLLYLCSCSEAEENTLPAPIYLIEATPIGTFDGEAILARYETSDSFISLLNASTLRTVEVYEIVYNTIDTDDQPVQASGVFIFPNDRSAYPLISYQHGTITDPQDAPSYYQPGTEAYEAGTLLAATGYAVAMPDYLGYGASETMLHPYEHGSSLATASRDMLRAVREFCERNRVVLNDQLFLTGYSEGGYATMALHQLLETAHSDEFIVTASAPGAGAYHKTAFAERVVNAEEELSFINTYLWVLSTYNWVYGLNRPYSDFVVEPYDAIWEQAAPVIDDDAAFPQNPQELFQPAFLAGIQEGTDTALLNTFTDNDVHDWAPQAPIRLYHGTADDFVPYFNSQDAYEAMRANGATQVELMPIEGGDHFTSITTFTLGVFSYFNTLKAGS